MPKLRRVFKVTCILFVRQIALFVGYYTFLLSRYLLPFDGKICEDCTGSINVSHTCRTAYIRYSFSFDTVLFLQYDLPLLEKISYEHFLLFCVECVNVIQNVRTPPKRLKISESEQS